MCHAINQSINPFVFKYSRHYCILTPCDVKDIDKHPIILSQRSTEQMRKIPTIALSITYKGVKFIDAANKVMTSSSSVVHPKWADKQPVIKLKPSGSRASLCAHHVTWPMNRHTEDLRFIEWLLADSWALWHFLLAKGHGYLTEAPNFNCLFLLKLYSFLGQ